jgi:rubrerythrin
MPDKVLICQNCQSPFVYSEYEQTNHIQDNQPAPLYCPICHSIKSQEAKRPAKPKTEML